MITFTLTEGLLFIIAGTLMVVAGLLIWVAVRVSKVSGKAEEVLADARKTVGRIDGIAETIESGVALVGRAKRGLRMLLGGAA